MPQLLNVPANTNERFTVPVSVAPTLGETVTGYGVSFALIAPAATPQSGDWVAGSWATGGPPYIAVSAVTTRAAGTYRLWLRITNATETVLRRVAVIEFT